MTLRIIAGKWRRRTIVQPKVAETRPVPDRVKEAIFSMLGSYFGCPGELPAIHVADVFSGSGSMGMEALSRGAESCCFFERSPIAIAALQQSFTTLSVGPEAVIVRGDAWSMCTVHARRRPFDLVLLDPPYADSDDPSENGHVATLLAELAAVGENSSLVVLHHRAGVGFSSSVASPWNIYEERKFGSNGVTFFERRSITE